MDQARLVRARLFNLQSPISIAFSIFQTNASRIAAAFQRWRGLWSGALIAIVVGWVYLPVVDNGFITYDDCVYVVDNTHVRAGFSVRSVEWAFTDWKTTCNWHPVTWLSHILDSELYGLSPWGHHLTNLLLHAANSALLFLVFYRMTGGLGRSMVVAGLFGLHPMHVESVAWVAERKDVLSAFFFLGTLLAYGEYARAVNEPGSRARRFYWLALSLFELGLMSKPMVVTTPFVLLLLDYWPLGRLEPRSVWKLVVEKLWFFALAAPASLVTYVAQSRGGAMNEVMNPVLRMANAVAGYARYLGKLFWPVDLAAFYPFQIHWPGLAYLLAVALLLAITVLVTRLGPRCKYLPVGWFWFLGMLVPVIGLVQVGSQSMADRYSYLPSIGLALAVVWGAGEMVQHRPRARWLLAAAAVLAGLGCVAATRRQIGYWKDGETLFRHALVVTEPNYFPHLSLGGELGRRRMFTEAIAEDREAIRLYPGCAEAHSNLGASLCQVGSLEEAIAELKESLRLTPAEALPHVNLAAAYTRQGKVEEAIRHLTAAVALDPDCALNQYLLGTSLAALGRAHEALPHLQTCVRLDPGAAGWHSELAAALLKEGRSDEAVREWEAAIRLNPGDVYAHFNLEAAVAGRAAKP